MNGLSMAFGVVCPLTLYMAVGMLVRKSGIVSQNTFQELNTLIFRLFLPLSLFREIYTADLRTVVQPRLLLLSVGGILLVFFLSFSLTSRFIKEKRDARTMAQGIFRSNFVLFGSAICASLYGDSGAAAAAALAVAAVPLFNILAVLNFELLPGGKIRPGRLLLQIVKNPLVLASLLGIVCNLTGLKLPQVILTPLSALGGVATPLALVTLGGLLSFRSMAGHKGRLLTAALCKLVAVPALTLPLFIALGYRREFLAAVFSLFASPTAVASVPMAYNMGGNGELAGEIVAATTVGSLLTIFAFTFLLSAAGVL